MLGRLTGTSGSSGVEQRLLLMQPPMLFTRASHCLSCAFSFQQLRVEASFTSGPFPARAVGVFVTSQSFACYWQYLCHICSPPYVTRDPAIFLKLSKST